MIGFFKHKQREIKQNNALKRELIRSQQYKENMYFEAVEDILKKLSDPKVKTTIKARLQKELSELDPNGIIQRYVKEGGERPDISDIINTP